MIRLLSKQSLNKRKKKYRLFLHVKVLCLLASTKFINIFCRFCFILGICKILSKLAVSVVAFLYLLAELCYLP